MLRPLLAAATLALAGCAVIPPADRPASAGAVPEVPVALSRARAEGATWPNWNEGDEFRGVRDKSCAASPGGC